MSDTLNILIDNLADTLVTEAEHDMLLRLAARFGTHPCDYACVPDDDWSDRRTEIEAALGEHLCDYTQANGDEALLELLELWVGVMTDTARASVQLKGAIPRGTMVTVCASEPWKWAVVGSAKDTHGTLSCPARSTWPEGRLQFIVTKPGESGQRLYEHSVARELFKRMKREVADAAQSPA